MPLDFHASSSWVALALFLQMLKNLTLLFTYYRYSSSKRAHSIALCLLWLVSETNLASLFISLNKLKITHGLNQIKNN